MNRKQITIYDIAREAGVSPATVSRILTGSAKVGEEKRACVMTLIGKYSFRPNAMARGLSETQSRVIGMMMVDASNPYYNSLFAACVNEAYSRGYSVMMYNTLSKPELEDATLNKLLEQRVDVILICGGRIDLAVPDAEFMRLLEKAMATTPIVVATKSPHERIRGVSVDHAGSIDLALEYLVGLGHRDIGFVYAGKEYFGTVEKLDRFRLRMEQAGIALREEWLIDIPNYERGSGQLGVERLMRLGRLPTALLGLNDVITAGMLQGLLGLGLRVPEDMSLLSFDDTYITDITTPHLTAIQYDYAEYARLLVGAALAAATGRPAPMNQLVAPRLAVKESCVKPSRKICGFCASREGTRKTAPDREGE